MQSSVVLLSVSALPVAALSGRVYYTSSDSSMCDSQFPVVVLGHMSVLAVYCHPAAPGTRPDQMSRSTLLAGIVRNLKVGLRQHVTLQSGGWEQQRSFDCHLSMYWRFAGPDKVHPKCMITGDAIASCMTALKFMHH